MEKRDLQRIEQLVPSHPELARLWREHETFEQELDRLNGLRSLSPGELARRNELKKRKLAGRDQIQRILDAQA